MQVISSGLLECFGLLEHIVYDFITEICHIYYYPLPMHDVY